MTPSTDQPSRENVLYAFSVEPDVGRATLERYLKAYPQYAEDLVDLSYEILRAFEDEDESTLSAEDQLLIDGAWRSFQKAAPEGVSDPFAELSVTELREIARRVDVPRQVITAFRERRVLVESVPGRFLSQLATAMNSTVEGLLNALAFSPTPQLGRSYKADVKPSAEARISFERLLVDAGVSDEKRDVLLTDHR